VTLRRASTIFPVLAVALLLPGGASAMAAAPPSAEALSRVLSDPALWGKDFPAALMALSSWRRAGETTVAVFPDKMAGEKRYPKPDDAGRGAERLRQATAAPPPKPRSGLPGGLSQTLTAAREQLPRFRVEAPAFLEDDSFRVTWSAPSAQLLPPGLTVATVRERLGQPAEKRRVVLQTEGERRPVILTLNVYLGGAVVFAESDMAPRPGLVDRVLLDVPAMTAVLFEEAP
jgi:hypothetical protein